MARIIEFDTYRRGDVPPSPLDRAGSRSQSRLAASIWDKDYTAFEDIVHGMLLVRQILDEHLHSSEEWKYHLLELLDQAYQGRGRDAQRPQGNPGLAEAAARLKGYVAEEISILNREDLSVALVVLELIQKANRTQVSPPVRAMANPARLLHLEPSHG